MKRVGRDFQRQMQVNRAKTELIAAVSSVFEADPRLARHAYQVTAAAGSAILSCATFELVPEVMYRFAAQVPSAASNR